MRQLAITFHAPPVSDRSRQRQQIIRLLSNGGDYTRREIAAAVGIEICTACARLAELMRDGMVGEREKRLCIIYPNNAVKTYAMKFHQ
jgi:predicted ArsR family transcriptional regulator